MANFDINVYARDNASKSLKKVDRNLNKLEKSSKSLNGVLSKVGAALAAFGIGRAFAGIVKIGAAFEDLRDTLHVVEGSANKGAAAFDNIAKLATKTTFGVEALADAYIMLKSSGLDPSNKLMLLFADTASTTTDQVGALTAITQLYSRSLNKVGQDDFNKLTERGIPALRLLREGLGLTNDEILKMGRTTSGAKILMDELSIQLEKTYGGASKLKLDNLSVAQSNFNIQVSRAADIMFDEFGPALAETINKATEFIAANDALFKSLGQDLVGAIDGVSDAVIFLTKNFKRITDAISVGIWTLFGGVLLKITTKLSGMTKNFKDMGKYLKSVGKTLAAVISKFGLFGAVITAIGTAYFLMGDKGLDAITKLKVGTYELGEITTAIWDMIAESVSSAWDGISDAATTTFGYLGDWLKQVANDTISLGMMVGKVVLQMFIGLLQSVKGVFMTIAKFPIRLADAMIDMFGAFKWSEIFMGDTSSIKAGAKNFANVFKGTLDKEFAGVKFIPDNITSDFGKDHLGSLANFASVIKDDAVQAFLGTDFMKSIEERVKIARANAAKLWSKKDSMGQFGGTPTIPFTEVSETATKATKAIKLTTTALDAMDHEMDDIDAQFTKLDSDFESAISWCDELTNSFKVMGESMSKSMSDALAKGELSFASFRDYLKGWAQEVMSQVIQKMLMDPLTESLADLGSTLVKGITGTGGGFGDMFTTSGDGLLGSIMSFFSSSSDFDLMSLFSGFFADGGRIPGGRFGVVGEQGPELISGPANITPINNTNAAPININISAIDTQSGTQFLIERKEEIAGIIQRAYTKQGKQGIY
jgi:tape measure domain-containing protein